MSNLKDISPTICPWPWTTIHVATNSHLSHCCEARDFPISAQDTSLQTFWNSKEIQLVRATMLTGKWHDSCLICKKREKNNIKSKRQMALYKADTSGWHGYTTEQIKKLILKGTRVTEPIKQIDIRFGTTCNLSCRMCGPWSSSMWAQIVDENKEAFEEIGWNDPVYQSKMSIKSQKSRWWQQKKFLNSLIDACGGLHSLNITGGEPTLIPELVDVLKQVNKDCLIQLTTNGTLFNKKLYNELSKFKNTWFVLSIDGVGDTYNYIRHPGDWNTVNSNVPKFKDYVKEISVETATTIFNILDITNIWEWAYKNELDILHPNWVSEPQWTSVYAIPENVKSIAMVKVSKVRKEFEELRENFTSAILSAKFDPTFFEEFKINCKLQDKLYNKQLTNYLPELKELLT
jgi:wyosine [tRNA(Phe)-imidazoG37] synthetase (radical SAM superfamily)